MKQYKLKLWYPTLPKDWGTEHDYVHHPYGDVMQNITNKTRIPMRADELHLDFWELIEEKPKPLFITEDGVDKFYSNQPLWEVNKDFEKLVTTVAWVASKGSKYFSHEGNADKYIEENKPKPLFITEDGVDYYKFDFAVGFNIHNQSTINHNDWREQDLNNFKIFANKSNADEYIWKNKRVFSFEDMMKAKHSIILTDEDIEKAAKKRSEQ